MPQSGRVVEDVVQQRLRQAAVVGLDRVPAPLSMSRMVLRVDLVKQ